MTKIRNLPPVVEPTGKLEFGSEKSLLKHVLKHVLNTSSARWKQLIDACQLAEAQREYQEQLPKKPMLQRTMQDYSSHLSESVLRLTREKRGHCHFYQEPLSLSETDKSPTPDRLPNNAWQTILLWDLHKKILIVVKSFVRNGKFQPYVLCTGYRLFPKPDSSLRKDRKHRLRDQLIIRRDKEDIILAYHDQ